MSSILNRVRMALADPAAILPRINGQPPLNSREIEAVGLAIRGKSLADVAEVMDVSRNTAGSYYKGIARKTGISKPDLAPFVISYLKGVIGDGKK